MAENDINANMFSRLDQFDLYNRLLSRQGSTELVLERCSLCDIVYVLLKYRQNINC